MSTSWARRHRLDIVYDILKVAEEGALKTHIVYESNINSRLIAKYLHSLTEAGMLNRQDGNSGSSLYKTTERGTLFVKSYESLRTIFDPEAKLMLALKHKA